MKSRLGIKSRLGSKLTNRIGSAILENNDRIEIFECTFDSEEEELRADALKTIDLRKRISNKEVGYSDRRIPSFTELHVQYIYIVCVI